MEKKHPAICKNMPHILHGGDYNPDQWLDRPDILKEDLRLMKLAGINSATVAIFAWKALEPAEGLYQFEWLDRVMDTLWENGVSVVLATPSGGHPDWLDRDHPEALRVNADRTRILHGGRENHCLTDPYFRAKTREINAKLAERYRNHPALALWHVSNEFNGDCHCPRCQAAFREWLRQKYGDISTLNSEWWTAFWSHTYSDFSSIESPCPHGETSVHGLKLDWMRFVSDQTASFVRNEIAPLRELTPGIPVTTNLMGTYPGLDPWRLAGDLDVVSWDSYPRWHRDSVSDLDTARHTAFCHDLNRSLLKGPFLLMECTPSLVNWQPVNKLKRPGMHTLASVQAVAHGSDSIQYFQWRKGRGASEKLHGAVVDHVGHEHTRVFGEVARVGELLAKLDGVVGTDVPAGAALIYDWENRWAIEDLQGLSTERDYEGTCVRHHAALGAGGVLTDIVSMDADLSGYKLVSAPMLYMLRPGVAKKLEDYVRAGGTLVLTYLTGYVNQNDLCFTGGFPGDGLGKVAGVWAEEIDSLYPGDRNSVVFPLPGGGEKRYEARAFCELIHPLAGCETLARYGGDFYADTPAVTRNRLGEGCCYYLAARAADELLEALYGALADELGLRRAFEGAALPQGVLSSLREGDGETYRFLMNFTDEPKTVVLPEGARYRDVSAGGAAAGSVRLGPYGFAILTDL